MVQWLVSGAVGLTFRLRGGVCLAAIHAQQAEKEAAEDGFDAEHEAGGRGQREAEHALGREIAEAGAVPDVYGVSEDARADQQKRAAEDETNFKIDVVEDAFELWVGWKKTFLRSEDAGADGEDGDVGSDEDEAERVGEGVDVEGPAAERLWAGQKPERDDEAHEKSDDAGVEEEPARAEEKKEAEMTPTIAPGCEDAAGGCGRRARGWWGPRSCGGRRGRI